ncbi:hypothetical protein GCM10009764_70800 [Nocardia ninae]|uniref:Uncharacterized protein n=1 Tax=Nocardia ninae NBRC 108245 TaxID=1210091 RepID=A0A511MV49_9NOCA|nr:hypothetical protein NN4_88000 [Nocardia ninae NBRC 108245]
MEIVTDDSGTRCVPDRPTWSHKSFSSTTSVVSLPPGELDAAVYRQRLNSNGPNGIGRQTSTEPEMGAAESALAMPVPNTLADIIRPATMIGRIILEFI